MLGTCCCWNYITLPIDEFTEEKVQAVLNTRVLGIDKNLLFFSLNDDDNGNYSFVICRLVVSLAGSLECRKFVTFAFIMVCALVISIRIVYGTEIGVW